MTARFAPHIPEPVADVLGMPPFLLHTWWQWMRDAGIDVPRKYEGEVSAALYFLLPFAIRDGERWEDTAKLELIRIRDGAPFRPESLAIAPAPDPAAIALIQALRACVHALRSYQFGNSATDLAKDTADAGDLALRAAGVPDGSL